jgi:hypothetical protein
MSSIVKECKETRIAARLADNLVLGGESDWFLPSIDELKLMYDKKGVIRGFALEAYWSSSKFLADKDNGAWYYNFYNGYQGGLMRGSPGRVHPMRSF